MDNSKQVGELWDEIEREVQFIKEIKVIMASTQNQQEIGKLVQIAFNKMNKKEE